MGYARKKLKPRLNGGLYKMNKNKGSNNTTRAAFIDDPSEIGILELSELFLTNKQTISLFVKANIITPKRKEIFAYVFDRETVIKTLNNYIEFGRLTTIGMYSKRRKLK